MEVLILLSIIYIIGFNISYWMLSTEHRAEGLVYTIGDSVVCLLLSLFSWGAVLWCLVTSWVGKIRHTGHWDKPVTEVREDKAKSNGVQSRKQIPA